MLDDNGSIGGRMMMVSDMVVVEVVMMVSDMVVAEAVMVVSDMVVE